MKYISLFSVRVQCPRTGKYHAKIATHNFTFETQTEFMESKQPSQFQISFAWLQKVNIAAIQRTQFGIILSFFTGLEGAIYDSSLVEGDL